MSGAMCLLIVVGVSINIILQDETTIQQQHRSTDSIAHQKELAYHRTMQPSISLPVKTNVRPKYKHAHIEIQLISYPGARKK
jgi:hypothetical protein